MKDNYKADVSHTDEFDKMYQEMVKQVEDKYKTKSEYPETAKEAANYYRAGKIVSVIFNDANYEDKVELNLGDYEVKEEGGKWFAVKKKKEYPKTYEGCCKVMGINHTNDLDICEHCDYKTEITFYEDSLLEKIETLYRLIVCRNAYWKIAGEEIGLDGPWEPDWDAKDNHFYTIHTFNGKIECSATAHRNAVLIFLTAEMRDAFYEVFKELIEECKELL